MAKFYGIIGYGVTEQTEPGVWVEKIVERKYYGDVVRNYRRSESTEHLNDDLNISNTFSIVADAFAYDHCFAIRYIFWMGAKWKVTGVEMSRPRLLLTVGGVYRGPEDE